VERRERRKDAARAVDADRALPDFPLGVGLTGD